MSNGKNVAEAKIPSAPAGGPPPFMARVLGIGENQAQLTVSVKSRDKVFFENVARALTSYNPKGVFDILPYHANFISLVKEWIIIHKIDGQSERIDIASGIIKVQDNRVDVFLDIVNPMNL